MPETKTPNRSPKRKPSDPKDRPVRDSQENPAPNPANLWPWWHNGNGMDLQVAFRHRGAAGRSIVLVALRIPR